MSERAPICDGRFYPEEAESLRSTVEDLLGSGAGSEPVSPALGAVAPHAGYVYSGGVAGAVFGSIRVPDCVVLLGPNHTGLGAHAAVRARGDWVIPGQSVAVDEATCDALLARVPWLSRDARAHAFEHSLEVELPFLAARNPRMCIVPIVLMTLSPADCAALGQTLAEVLPADALVVASSDMNHFLPDDVTRERDRLALDPLLALDGRKLYEVVTREDLSMCGFVPATVLCEYANRRGARESRLCGYATSGDVSGDRARVVGYAGVAIS
jgi:AmmeMemoRadiSam system protein B